MNKNFGWRMMLLLVTWAALPSAQADELQRQAIIQELTGDISSAGGQALSAVSAEAGARALADTGRQVTSLARSAREASPATGPAGSAEPARAADNVFRAPSTQTAGDCQRGARREVLAPNR